MSAVVRLAGRLPGDIEINGLDSIADELCARPDDVVVALVWFDVSKVTRDVDSHTDVPTVRVRRVEPLGGVADIASSLTAMAEKAFEERTGRKALPFDQLELDDEDDL